MRRGIPRLKGIKVVTKPDGRRYIYRRTPGGLVPLPDLSENHPNFLAAYANAPNARPPRSSAVSGSIAAICEGYLRSAEHARLKPSTRAVWRRIADKIREERGKGMVADLTASHLRRDVHALTPGAARNRLKVWRAILGHALRSGQIETDPSRDVSPPAAVAKPHRQWQHHEREAFRAHWAVGTSERLAFEVLDWTAARCVDAVTLGWQMVGDDGWLSFTQAKTGNPVALPITAPLPAWAAAFEDDRRHLLACLPGDRLQWITTIHGKPRSHKSMSQWFSKAASAAGLPDDCTAHGLRKARAAAVAEVGGSASRIGAWIGDVSLQMAAHYTRQADRRAILTGAEQEQNTGNRGLPVSKLPRKPLG